MSITVEDAIRSLKPGASCFIVDGKITKWDGPGTQPTDSEIAAEKTKLETEYTNKKYQRDRAAEFPSYGEQLDYIYHHGVAKWKTDIVQPVKDKFPKP